MKYSFSAFIGLSMCVAQSVFGQAEPLYTIPYELIGHHIFVEAEVNGSEPLNFIFDTGASTTIINHQAAEALGLPEDLHAMATGISGDVAVTMSLDNELQLSSLVLRNIQLVNTSLDHLSRYIGRQIDGIIGYELLRRYTVQIATERQQIYIFEADSYRPEREDEVLPFELRMNIPVIQASLETAGGTRYSGQFLIDTGAGSALSLNAPFVSDEGLLEKVNPSYPNRSYGLSNRSTQSYIGRIAAFHFGNYSFTNIPTKLSTAYQGVEAMDDFLGIIGNDFLQKFTLTFDYYNQLLYISPAKGFSLPLRVNCSGLKLRMNARLTQVEVLNVISNSPANHAGLRRGDIILGLDGQSAKEFPLHIIQENLRQAGEQIELKIKRGNQYLSKKIKLKPLI